MSQPDEKNPIQALVNELADLEHLLNGALAKATHLENSPRLTQFNSEKPRHENTSTNNSKEEKPLPKPSNWGQLKDIALADSMQAMEDDEIELAKDTTKTRTIKPRSKKSRIDNNWEDDPI